MQKEIDRSEEEDKEKKNKEQDNNSVAASASTIDIKMIGIHAITKQFQNMPLVASTLNNNLHVCVFLFRAWRSGGLRDGGSRLDRHSSEPSI